MQAQRQRQRQQRHQVLAQQLQPCLLLLRLLVQLMPWVQPRLLLPVSLQLLDQLMPWVQPCLLLPVLLQLLDQLMPWVQPCWLLPVLLQLLDQLMPCHEISPWELMMMIPWRRRRRLVDMLSRTEANAAARSQPPLAKTQRALWQTTRLS